MEADGTHQQLRQAGAVGHPPRSRAAASSISTASARWTRCPPRCSSWTSSASTTPWPRRASSKIPIVAHRGHELRSRPGGLSRSPRNDDAIRSVRMILATDRPGHHAGAGGIRIEVRAPQTGGGSRAAPKPPAEPPRRRRSCRGCGDPATPAKPPRVNAVRAGADAAFSRRCPSTINSQLINYFYG